MHKRAAFLFIFVVFIATECRHPVPDAVLDLEVGYPLVFGEGHTWALCRVPRAASPRSIQPDHTVKCAVECKENRCHVVAVSDAPVGTWVKGRVIRESDDGSEAFIVVEPFPIDTPRRLELRLALSDGITKFVRGYYRRQADGELKFDRIEYAGEARRPPVVWK